MITDENMAALNYLMNYNLDFNRINMSLGELINSVKFNKEQWNKILASGETDMGTKDATEKVIKSVLHDEKLSNLRLADSSLGIDGSVINVCLVDDEAKEAVFVFRGISDKDWLYNSDKLAMEESQSQRISNEFFRETVENNSLKEKGFTINVTGFSNGGNNAQYVAIANIDTVDRCVTFNAPGFSDTFIQKYEPLINMQKDKMVAYASDKDAVSALGNNISGKQIFLEGKAHRPISEFPIAQQLFNHPMFAFVSVDNDKLELSKQTDRKEYPDRIHNACKRIMSLPSKISHSIFDTGMHLLLKADDIDKDRLSEMEKSEVGKLISKVIKDKIFVEKAGIQYSKYKGFMGTYNLETMVVKKSREDYKSKIDELRQGRNNNTSVENELHKLKEQKLLRRE